MAMNGEMALIWLMIAALIFLICELLLLLALHGLLKQVIQIVDLLINHGGKPNIGSRKKARDIDEGRRNGNINGLSSDHPGSPPIMDSKRY